MHMRFYDYLCKTPVAFLAVIWLTDKQNQYEWKKKIKSKTHKILQTNLLVYFWKHTHPPPKKNPYTVWNDQNLKKNPPQNFNTWLCQFLMLTDTTEKELFPNKNFPLVNLSITDCLNASKIAKWIFNYFSVQIFFS